MIDEHINNPKSQKYYVRRYFDMIRNELKGKKVIDIPAGNGVTTEILMEAGADVEPFDLFPEYFLLKNVVCKRADITERIPVPDEYADWVTCQEGIEHFSDQLRALKEINRVLKKMEDCCLQHQVIPISQLKSVTFFLRVKPINKCLPMNLMISGWQITVSPVKCTTGISS